MRTLRKGRVISITFWTDRKGGASIWNQPKPISVPIRRIEGDCRKEYFDYRTNWIVLKFNVYWQRIWSRLEILITEPTEECCSESEANNILIIEPTESCSGSLFLADEPEAEDILIAEIQLFLSMNLNVRAFWLSNLNESCSGSAFLCCGHPPSCEVGIYIHVLVIICKYEGVIWATASNSMSPKGSSQNAGTKWYLIECKHQRGLTMMYHGGVPPQY